MRTCSSAALSTITDSESDGAGEAAPNAPAASRSGSAPAARLGLASEAAASPKEISPLFMASNRSSKASALVFPECESPDRRKCSGS
eukprot:scaffold61696_cov81-Phaeocystis_antarctica.AAC.1